MNPKQKILIIGGVAGGATAIARLRRLNEDAEMILFERGGYVSFANCGLPYYVGGVIPERDHLFVSNKQMIEGRFNVEVRLHHEVMSIDPAAHQVTVTDHETGKSYTESYDKLLLSPGSRPIVPPLEGLDSPNVFTLWNIDDTDKVYSYIAEHKPQRAVVVGGGFIGVEMAENLVERGMQVTMVEMAPQVMAPFDPDMSILLENELRCNGVDLKLGVGLQAVKNGGKEVLLADGSTIPADLVMLSIGVRPNSELAKQAGLETNPRGGIVTDEYMQTSDPDIYAVGDASQVIDFNTKQPTMVPLAGPANKQGRIVAENMLGLKKTPYTGTQGTSVAKVFSLTAASTGLNEKALNRDGKEYGKDYQVTLIHPMSHAGYYPGAFPLTLKLISSKPTGKVLGAQAIGMDGVDKRIDVLATAIRFGATVYDLQNLELAYAPPYSSAKDPVNMAGYAAANQLEGLTEGVMVRELDDLPKDTVLIDLRENEETVAGMIPGAIHIPLATLRGRLDELDKSKDYLVYCAVGLRGYYGDRIMRQHGFKSKNLLGGYRAYMDSKVCATAACCNILHGGGNTHDDGQPLKSGDDSEGGAHIGAEAAPSSTGPVQTIQLDVCGLSCPGPIVKVSQALQNMSEGDQVDVVATDPGFARDIVSWCENTGNKLIESGRGGGKFTARIQKGVIACPTKKPEDVLCNKEKTMIVFDGDLDKAIASFIIATGAAAMGNQVNMFFTFWGLNILRRPEKVKVKKDFMSKMFASMMPRGSRKLGLSKMNFMGAGARMIRSVMKKKNIDSLEQLIENARAAGVKMTACQMSMDVMGITAEELIPGVEIGGVASMLNDNDHSNMNLFI